MKIAVANNEGQVSQHFGYCEKFTVFEVENKSITGTQSIPNPGHQPGLLPRLLGEAGVNLVIAGGMGSKAIELFADKGIDVVIGASGPVEAVVKDYLQGKLETAGSACHHETHS